MIFIFKYNTENQISPRHGWSSAVYQGMLMVFLIEMCLIAGIHFLPESHAIGSTWLNSNLNISKRSWATSRLNKKFSNDVLYLAISSIQIFVLSLFFPFFLSFIYLLFRFFLFFLFFYIISFIFDEPTVKSPVLAQS